MCIKVNTLKIENNKLYGTIKWVRNYTDVKIVFDGLPREDLSLIFKYEFINDIDLELENGAVIKEPQHRIYIGKGVTLKYFIKAIVEIFAAAFTKADEE